MEVGLIDGIKTYDEVMGKYRNYSDQSFSGITVHEVVKKNKMSRFKTVAAMLQ